MKLQFCPIEAMGSMAILVEWVASPSSREGACGAGGERPLSLCCVAPITGKYKPVAWTAHHPSVEPFFANTRGALK